MTCGKLVFFFILMTLVSSPSYALETTLWLDSERALAVQKILKNISPAEAAPGAVIAAPTRVAPNYYYHWVRDAGLTIDALVSEYETSNAAQKAIFKTKINQYVDFSEKIQNDWTLTGLGEPKFNVDGSANNDAWGRPQNDSPALRAISLIHWFNVLQKEGSLSKSLSDRLYDGKIPANSVIKKDLEYISHHWREPSFDLWEEVKGDHFYTRMVQRRALIEGARLATALNDQAAASWYLLQAKEIETDLPNFWNASKGYFVATRNWVEGVSYKDSGLDIAVILGLLHGSVGDGFLSFHDRRVQATMEHLKAAFEKTYAINARIGVPGTAIGRYPEDRYSGAGFNGGNPWPLCTLAMAEANYREASELKHLKARSAARAATMEGDEFVARVQYHANTDGSLNEQINRETGFMTSVSDLTWNYAAILTTARAHR